MFGGHGRGWRHRRVYHSTGIPGYGRGRCAWRNPAQAPPGMARPEPRPAFWPARGLAAPGLSVDEELRMLEEEEEMLEQGLDDLGRALEYLRDEKEKEVNK